MNINEILQALTAGLQKERGAVNLNFSNPLHQMPNDTVFDEEGWSNTIILNGARPDWVHDADIVSFDINNDTTAFANQINEDSAFWEEELAFRVFDRNQHTYFPEAFGPEAEMEPTKEQDEDEGDSFVALADGAIHLVHAPSMEDARQVLMDDGCDFDIMMTEETARSLYIALFVVLYGHKQQ